MTKNLVCCVILSFFTLLTSEIVPIINISTLFSTDIDSRLEVANQIGKACEEVGFFVVTGHNVPDNILTNACKYLK
jgi:isopenicillin N synthase-like dioxygenase